MWSNRLGAVGNMELMDFITIGEGHTKEEEINLKNILMKENLKEAKTDSREIYLP